MSVTYDPVWSEISSETFDRLEASIKSHKGTPKMPSNASPQRLYGEKLAGYNQFAESFKDNYEVGAWAEALQTVQAGMEQGFQPSPLVHAQALVSSCVAANSGEAVPELIGYLAPALAEFPQFGDLYLAMAVLKLVARQYDASARLIALARLCPSPHVSLNLFEETVQYLLTYSTKEGKVLASELIDLTSPDAIEAMKERLGILYDDEVTALAEKIQEDPSQAYTLYNQHECLKSYHTDAGAWRKDNPLPAASVLKSSPLASLLDSTLERIVSYLPLTSLLHLRATNSELKKSIDSLSIWSKVTESIVGARSDFFSSPDMPLAAVEKHPFQLYSLIKSLIRLNDILCSNMSVDLSEKQEKEFIKVWFDAPGGSTQLVSLTASSPLFDMLLAAHLANMAGVCSLYPSASMDFFLDATPRLLQRLVNLLAYRNPWMIPNFLGVLISIVRTHSKKRAVWVAQLRHWRVPSILKLLTVCFSTNAAFPALSAYALLQGEDLLTDLWPYQISYRSNEDNVEELWWLVKSPIDASISSAPTLTCCKLKLKGDGQGNTTITGVTFGGDSKKEIQINQGAMGSAEGALSFVLDVSTGPYAGEHQFDGPNTLNFGSGCGSYMVVNHELKTASRGGFFMFADSRPLTPELWTLAKNKVLAPAKSKEPVTISLSDESSSELFATMYMAQTASQFSTTVPNFLGLVANDLKTLQEVPVDPLLCLTVHKHRAESQKTFEGRAACFAATTNGVRYQRVFHAAFYASELENDIKVIKQAIRATYPKLPARLLEDGLGLDNPTQQLSSILQKLDSADLSDHAVLMNLREQMWAERRTEYSEAASAILEALLRSGTSLESGSSSNGSEVIDTVPESELYTIYKKWSWRLYMPHPKLQIAASCFNFDYLLFVLLEARDIAAEMAKQAPAQKAKFALDDSDREIYETKKKESGISSDTMAILAVCAVAITSIAIGVGAFFVGRRLSRQD